MKPLVTKVVEVLKTLEKEQKWREELEEVPTNK